MFKPQLCTMYELQTEYSVEDLYDFLEMIDVKNALDKEAYDKAQKETGRQ